MTRNIRIGTRGSALALWQANKVKAELEALGLSCELQIIKTQGDKIQNIGFDKMEGKGFFTKEIEEALLQEQVDVAVHSLKDMPTVQPQGLVLGGLSNREDPADLLIARPDSYVQDQTYGLPVGAIVGTSSIRRKTQLLSLATQVKTQDLRGNVPTRVDKLRAGNYDAIILASAGINRLELDLSDLKTTRLHPREFVPAPGQGVIAYQVREGDREMRKIIQNIHQVKTATSTNIERKVLQLMDGGCQVPLGAYCEVDQVGNFHLYGAYAPEGGTMLRHHLSQSTSHQLAEAMVEKLTSTVI